MWDEDGEEIGTWYLIEFMDTNCGHCINAARDDFPSAQANWLGEDAPRPTPDNINVEFLAVSISLWEDTTPGKEYGKEEIGFGGLIKAFKASLYISYDLFSSGGLNSTSSFFAHSVKKNIENKTKIIFRYIFNTYQKNYYR